MLRCSHKIEKSQKQGVVMINQNNVQTDIFLQMLEIANLLMKFQWRYKMKKNSPFGFSKLERSNFGSLVHVLS